MVDFTLTDEQKDIQEMAHDFAEKEIRPVAWEFDKDGTWPQEIIGVFDKSDPQVLELGAIFMRLLVVANLATSFSVIWGAVLNGAGDTQPPMLIAVVANWVIKLPLAYLMAVPWGMGVEGVWWAMFISLVFESGATYVWYARDRWIHAKV